MTRATAYVDAAHPLPTHAALRLLPIGGASAAGSTVASVVPRNMDLRTTNDATTLAAAAPLTPMRAALLLAFTVNPSASVTATALSLPRSAEVPAAAPSLSRRTTLVFVPFPLLFLPSFPVAAAATTPVHARAAPLLHVTLDAIPTVSGATPPPLHTTATFILSRRSAAVVAAAPFPPRAVVSLIVPLVLAAGPFSLDATTVLLLGIQLLAMSTTVTPFPRLSAFPITQRCRRRSDQRRARLRLPLLLAAAPNI